MKPTHVLFVCFLSAALASLAAEARHPIVPGAPVPPFGIEEWIEGPPSGADTWRFVEGRVVVVEFWATWCKACVTAIPHLNDLVKEFDGKDVQFISISDESASRVKHFLERTPIAGWVALDTDSSMFKEFGVSGIPHTVVVGTDGSIVLVTRPWNLTADILDKVLKGEKVDIPDQPPPAQHTVHRASGRRLKSPLFLATIGKAESAGGMAMIKPGHVTIKGAPLAAIYLQAYQVPVQRIVVDNRIPTQVYDVEVIVPVDPVDRKYEVLKEMLSSTFGYTVRFEDREIDTFILRRAGNRKPVIDVYNEVPTNADGTAARVCKLSWLASYLESMTGTPVLFDTEIVAASPDLDIRIPVDLDGDPKRSVQWIAEQLGMDVVTEKRTWPFLLVAPAASAADVNSQPTRPD